MRRITKWKASVGSTLILTLLLSAGLAVLWAQNFERFRTEGRHNGLGWLAMNSEEKATYILGFEDGIQAAATQAAFDAAPKSAGLADKVEGELLVRDSPGLDVANQIDRIYKDDANLRLPISVAYGAVKLRTGGMREEGVQIFLKTMREPER